jgi:hypothetical protein
MTTHVITLKVTTDKEITDMLDQFADRIYRMDGVTDVTVEEHINGIETTTFDFERAITEFNDMYQLHCLRKPGVPPGMTRHGFASHLRKFNEILVEEIAELDNILDMVEGEREDAVDQIDVLTELADWLGDIQVYCASEMRKFGIPVNLILSIIMASNKSKLGEDGLPIYDTRGKVLKGPNYWKPEPQIKRALAALIRQHKT